MHTLIFQVGHLLESTTGTQETYPFEGPVEFEGIEGKSPIRGKVQIMRLDDGVNAHTSNVEISVAFTCQKCLKNFQQKVRVASAERQFLLKPPRQKDDINDIFLIDVKRQKIDLTEMLRQEILLHFPLIPVCSESCRGICPHCGKDLNKATCHCTEAGEKDNKPLAALKSLIKK